MITPTYGMHTDMRTCSLFYHDISVEPLLSHPTRLIFFGICMSSCFLFREMFPWLGFDLDYRDHTFDDGWFHATPFSTYHISDAILGHILFRMRFTDLHGVARSSLLMKYTPRRGLVHYFIMILQWSSSWAIQSGPDFSAFGCRHTSPFKVRLFYLWVWFNYGRGWLRLHIRWWMTWGHLIFSTYHTPNSILGNIPSSVEIYRFPLICITIPSCEMHVGMMIWLRFALILQWSLSWVI